MTTRRRARPISIQTDPPNEPLQRQGFRTPTVSAFIGCLLAACGSGESLTVVRAVDGDTVELSSGYTVRLIGIDAPETGVCGHGEATERMSQLARNRRVTLIAGAQDDVDPYGRLLRYVEVDGQDMGLAQIEGGHAVASDGFGPHPRENAYIAADETSDKAPCSDSFTYVDPPASSCSGARYDTCAEAKSAGCGPYYEGEAEYEWYRDADNDGIVCE